jgi:septum formation protein
MKKDFVYLASASPRRRELLHQIGVQFEVRVAEIDEQRAEDEAAPDYVQRMARRKADTVWTATASGDARPVLGADTVVVLDDEVFGKPEDARDAERMLERLSGCTHRVLTCVAVRFEEREEARLSTSEVRFRPTTAAERRAYCRNGESLDKAGGYGIQGMAAIFIEKISGSYSGIMGLPVYETAELLGQYGLPAWLATSSR